MSNAIPANYSKMMILLIVIQVLIKIDCHREVDLFDFNRLQKSTCRVLYTTVS